MTANTSVEFDFGYMCRCGVTHFGPYAYEDWRHHECLHSVPLMLLEVPIQVLCPDCGNVWMVLEDESPQAH